MWPVTGLLQRIWRASAGSSIVSISGWERRRRLRPRCKGDLYLYTHVSLVMLPGRIGLTAYP